MITDKKLSVVIPVYNDQEVLLELYKRLIPELEKICKEFEVLLIDDGSKDDSWKIIEGFTKSAPTIIKGIKLIRNFGQLNAITAGLDLAKGDYIVLMDSDLQDRPEDIVKFVKKIEEENVEMVIAKWMQRDDTFFKRKASHFFFCISNKVTNLNIQRGLGIFRIIKRELVEEIRNYPEKTASTLSLMYWIGVNYSVLELTREKRFAGKTGYNLNRMFKMALDRIFSYSMFPIQFAIYSGLAISFLSFIGIMILILRYYLYDLIPGWTSMIVLILFLFGINFIFLGILGEYVGRIFLESKSRPRYTIQRKTYQD